MVLRRSFVARSVTIAPLSFVAVAWMAFASPAAHAQDVDVCGKFFEGVECVLLAGDDGKTYLVGDRGGFDIGQYVHITGPIDPDCITICLEELLCVRENTIESCEEEPPPPPPEPVFKRGDADGNGIVNGLADALYILKWAFAAGSIPGCLDAADSDDNGTVSAIPDAVRLLVWSFAGGAPPLDPGPDVCGPDPESSDTLGCETQNDEEECE